jgi:hypothetical protein
MTRTTVLVQGCFIMLGLSFVACQAEEPDVAVVEGTASLAIEGAVESGVTAPRVALIWSAYDVPLSGIEVPVDDGGTYRLSAVAAPPDEAFSSYFRLVADEAGLVEPDVAVGVIVGLAGDDRPSTWTESGYAGAVTNHLVVFVREDLPEESFAGRVLGPLGAGYHLLRAVPAPSHEVWAARGNVCTSGEDDACGPTETSGSTGLELGIVFVPVPLDRIPALEAAGIPLML